MVAVAFNDLRTSLSKVMATYRIQPPDLEECKSFDVYLTKLAVWEATTPAEKSKRGALIAASLPNNSVKYKKDLQDKFFEQVDGSKLVTDQGLDLVKTFLKKELGESDLYQCSHFFIRTYIDKNTDLIRTYYFFKYRPNTDPILAHLKKIQTSAALHSVRRCRQ